eukprot:jgi/Chlat1/2639/Chrsp178S02485
MHSILYTCHSLVRTTASLHRCKLVHRPVRIPKQRQFGTSISCSMQCPSGAECGNGYCEYSHKTAAEQALALQGRQGPNKLVICAGPERSGSTWLFNAVRLMLLQAGEPMDSYWINSITKEKLAKRGVGRENANHVLVKTHEWSSEWDSSQANCTFLTHRDVCGVISSYVRVGWWPHSMPVILKRLDGYVDDHMRWHDVATHEVPFAAIVDPEQAVEQLSIIASHLKLQDVDVKQVAADVKALPIPTGSGPDAITKLWPAHMSKKDTKSRLTEAECSQIRQHCRTFQALYGYPTA